jgi:hypothetical protein
MKHLFSKSDISKETHLNTISNLNFSPNHFHSNNNEFLPYITQNEYQHFNSSSNLNSSNNLKDFLNKEIAYVNKLKYFKPTNFYDTDINLFNLKEKVKQNIAFKQSANILADTKLFKEKFKKISLDKFDNKKEKDKNSEKIGNKLIEEELEKSHDELSKKISKLCDKLDDLYEIKDQLTKELNDIIISIDFLNNYKSYSLLDKKIEKLLINSGDTKKEMFESKLKVERILEDKNSKVKEMLNSKLSQKKLYEEQINKSQNEIENINNDLKQYKLQYKNVREKLLVHYHKILYEGKDTRNEGLSWIIMKIWNLNSNVLLNFLPPFLDEECIIFLFKYTSGLIKINELNEKLNIMQIENDSNIKKHLKNNNPNKKSTVNYFNDTKDTFKTNLYDDKENEKYQEKNKFQKFKEKFHGKIENLNLYNSKKFKINFYNLQKFYNKSTTITTNEQKKDIQNFKNIKEFKDFINNFKRDLENLKRYEIERVSKEFYTSDYGRRFHISKQQVISALVGKEKADQEIYIIEKKQKDYFNTIRKLRNGSMWEIYANLKKKKKYEDFNKANMLKK